MAENCLANGYLWCMHLSREELLWQWEATFWRLFTTGYPAFEQLFTSFFRTFYVWMKIIWNISANAILQKLENGHILNKQSKIQQSITKWQNLGKVAKNEKSEGIVLEMKVSFYFLFHDHRPRYGRFVLHLLPGGQIHLGSFSFPNFKLVSKGHKRIRNQNGTFSPFRLPFSLHWSAKNSAGN